MSEKSNSKLHSSPAVVRIQTRNQEVQVEPETKPTKVYMDRSCSAKALTTRVVKPKAKTTADIGCNTAERISYTMHSPNKESNPSKVNTPSNVIEEANRKSRLFKKYNSNKFNTINASAGIINKSYDPGYSSSSKIGRHHKGSHSIDLENQMLLQQKYNDTLSNYPNNRMTPQVYDSIERPNSVTGGIKIRKSYDFNNLGGKNQKLKMYQANKGSKQKLGSSRYSNQSFK